MTEGESGPVSTETPAVDNQSDGVEVYSTSHPAEEKPEPKIEPVETDEVPAKAEEPQESETDADKKPSRWQRKKEKEVLLETENAQLKARAEEYEKRLAALEAGKPLPKAVDPTKEPVEADFANVLDFLEARQNWKIQEALKARDSQTAAQQKVSNYQQQIAEVAKEIPDFNERVQEVIDAGMVTPHLEAAILDSPMGGKITAHLLNHPDDLMVLQKLNPMQTAKAIGMIEAHIGLAPKQAVRTTSAPAPIAPVRPSAGTASKDPVEMTQYEYEKWRGFR